MTKDNSVTIGLVQTRVSDNINQNMERTIAKIKEAASRGAQIICLQELYRTKYFPTDEKTDATKLAETIPGETTLALSSLAKELNVIIIAPIFEVDSDRHYNTAVVIGSDGNIMGSYRKMHIPHDPFFYEKSYFEIGDAGYQIFRTPELSFGVLICYDQWFPEAARTLALQGADVIFYPSAIGYLEDDPLSQEDWHSAWENIQRSHAIANGIHVASVNRVGAEGKIRFWGASFVCDAFGRMIKRASLEDEEVIVAKLDISQNKRIQDGWGFLRNRLPATYGLLSSKVISDTPKILGFSMPAEWEPHESTWLSWPHNSLTFPDRIKKVEETYLHMIEVLHKHESINLFVTDLNMKSRVGQLLEQNGINLQKINFYISDYADVWFRDYGPVFLINKAKKQLAFVHWIFNAWGGKYKDLAKDSQIPYIISNRLQLNNFRPGIVLEGGSVEINGKGTAITTEQCLLNSNRNPNLSKPEIEKSLMDYYGINHVIWLKSGVAGDDTDGHIDNLARFVNPNTVLCAYEENESDENHLALKNNYDILINSTDQDGKKLEIIKMPMPPAILANSNDGKTRLPASYLNFYVANKVVLVPTFKHKNDRTAMKIIQKQFPGRKVIGIDCRDLIFGMGTIHCVTQQQPEI